jgi:ribosomal-protein-alanine N-acetyltransferase
MSDLFPETIETERLRLEQFGPEAVDLQEYYAVCSSDPGIEDVTARMPWEPHEHPKESLGVLERQAEKFDDGETATYGIWPREGEDSAGTFAGQTGLRVDWNRQVGTLGIWLRKPFWGRGYSGERAAALIALAFDRLDLETVSVSHEPDNDRSRRAIEKYVERFGGRREGRLRNHLAFGDGDVQDVIRYTISRGDYRRHGPDDPGVTFHDA